MHFSNSCTVCLSLIRTCHAILVSAPWNQLSIELIADCDGCSATVLTGDCKGIFREEGRGEEGRGRGDSIDCEMVYATA